MIIKTLFQLSAGFTRQLVAGTTTELLSGATRDGLEAWVVARVTELRRMGFRPELGPAQLRHMASLFLLLIINFNIYCVQIELPGAMRPNHALRPRLQLAPSLYPGRSISSRSESATMTLRLGEVEKLRIWLDKELVGSKRLTEEEKLLWDEGEQAFAMDITQLTDEGIASLGEVVSTKLTEQVNC